VKVLVSDTSVIVDLERGGLLEAAFSLSYDLAVPDILYDRELKGYGGEKLVELGLFIEELDSEEVSRALAYRNRKQSLSLPDCFGLTLAHQREWTLLTGDKDLRSLAVEESVNCHGVLWVLDQMNDQAVASFRMLHDGLTRIAEHPRCRLPKREITKRLEHYKMLIA
jgi:hypothetical protein